MDLKLFSKAVVLIHEASTAPERWSEALSTIAALFEAPRGAIIDVDAASSMVLGIENLGHDPKMAELYAQHYHQLDPMKALATSASPGEAHSAYSRFPESYRRRDEYFDFHRRCGIGDVVGVSTPAMDGQRTLLSLQRAPEAEAYDDEARRLLELLAPHLHIAKRVQTKFQALSHANLTLQAGFDQLAAPAFIVDETRFIQQANLSARRLFIQNRDISSRHGRLFLRNTKLDAALERAVRVAAHSHGRSTAFALTLNGEPGEALIAPLQPRQTDLAFAPPLALVMLFGRTPDADSIAWRLAQVYGLTPMESRVAAMLAAGESVKEIARANRVTEATLRTQLRSIFAKTNTSRQAELVQLALRGYQFRTR